MFYLIVIGFLIILKLYTIWIKGTCKSGKRLDGKTVIITGGNSGIGKETARDLAWRGARIIMASRNLELAKQARDEIAHETGNTNIVLEKLDLSEFQSIRDFAQRIKRTESRLDVLIHNAGVYLAGNFGVNSDGIELTFATNHLGEFLLTHLLFDLLKKTEHSRIVIMSSRFQDFSTRSLKDFDHKVLIKQNTLVNYCFTKRCNLLFMRELAKRLNGTTTTVNALHPGPVMTNIINKSNPITKFLVELIRIYIKTPEEGAQTQIYLAVSEEVENINGRYFENCREVKNICASKKELENAKYLWNLSKDLVILRSEEKLI